MKKIFKKLTLFCFLNITLIPAFSQVVPIYVPTLHNPTNSFINSLTYENNPLGLLWWDCNAMQPFQLFTNHKSHTGLSHHDSMTVVRQWSDDFVCLKHVLYQQYYKGILVEGAVYREHYDSTTNQVILSNGHLAEGLDLTASPTINEATALINALGHVGAELYAWQDDSMEYYLQLDSIPEMTTYYPQGELIFALIGNRTIKAENYKLAWKFRIHAIEPHSNQHVYVDAVNGEILKAISGECNGSFDHVYYGNKYLDTRWYGGLRQKHFLEADDNGRNIKTKDEKYNGNWGLSFLPNDKDDNWGSSHWGATSCHHVVQEAWYMFQYTFGRQGMNNNNKQIRVFGNDPRFQNNAGYGYVNSEYDVIIIGSTWQGNILATYDIAGHEFTHGVDEYSGALEYEMESGALDESFADIFGIMTERYAKWGSYNWTIGEDANFTLRDIQLPSGMYNTKLGRNYPDYYLQPGNWYPVVGCFPTASNDWCGVHHNSGVQNRYFYLLSMGGSQLGKIVQGVGIDIAAEVTYYSFTNLTTPYETYPEAREHAVAAARILYGRCSWVETQVCRAWSACNIGSYCEPCAEIAPCWSCNMSQSVPTAIDNKQLENRIRSVSIYPNPSEDFIIIDRKELTFQEISEINAEIVVSDMLGKVQISLPASKDAQSTRVNVSGISPGVYTVTIKAGGFQYSQKLIKK